MENIALGVTNMCVHKSNSAVAESAREPGSPVFQRKTSLRLAGKKQNPPAGGGGVVFWGPAGGHHNTHSFL